MNQTNDPFVPRAGFSQVGETVLVFLNQHLTAISIGVALVATILLIAGPVRLLLIPALTNESSDGPISLGEISLSGAIGGSELGETLERDLVPFTTIPNRPRNKVVSYTVKPGDTLMGIAEAFGLDRNTLFWSNSRELQGDVHMLQPGIDLAILPEDGVLHVSDETLTIQQIADKYSVTPDVIINSEYNELDGKRPDFIPPWGMRIIIPGGVGEFNADMWKPPVVEVEDPVTGQRTSAFMPNMSGSCRSGIAGSGGTGAWASPLPGAALTQGFYPGHSGVDLGAVPGTSVFAADSGVVIFSGWVPADWGYGILVVLDHGNGWTTYYAHLSVNGVGCGQLVPRGGYVGQVGSTGNSSGPHLHFEMRWGHIPDNPTGYVGF